MPTHITAVLDRAMVQQLLTELTPLRVRLGDAGAPDRYFIVDRPTSIELIPGRGVRFRTSAQAHWTLAGVPIPLTIESATLLLEPFILPPPDFGKLGFKLKMEELDLKNVPSMIDSKLLPLINEGLKVVEGPLGWNYAKTLNVHVQIPQNAAPLDAFTLAAGAATVEVSEEAIKMTLDLEMHFTQVGVRLAHADPVVIDPLKKSDDENA